MNQGDLILMITTLEYMRAVGYVDAQYLDRIREGNRVLVRVDFSDKELDIEQETFEGNLYFVAPRVDEYLKECEVYVKVRNKRNRNGLYILREGMDVRMEVLIGE